MTIINNDNNNYQFDMYHRFESQGPKFKRLIIDIEHLDLSKLNFIIIIIIITLCVGLYDGINDHKHIIGISKHLCGSGTGNSPVTIFSNIATQYCDNLIPLICITYTLPPPNLGLEIITSICGPHCFCKAFNFCSFTPKMANG